MAKEMKSRRDLVALIQEELRSEPDCAALAVMVTKGNFEGAYWTVQPILNSSGTDPCFLKALTIARRLAKRYNVVG